MGGLRLFRDEILEATLSNNPRDFLSKTRLGERQERAGEAQDEHPEAQQEPSERSGVAPDHSTTHLNHLVGLGGAPSGFESETLCVRSIRKVTPTTRTAEQLQSGQSNYTAPLTSARYRMPHL